MSAVVEQREQTHTHERSNIPDSGVHEAGRFRMAEGARIEKKEARNFGAERVSFGLDPAKPHAARMKAKDMDVKHSILGVLEQHNNQAISVNQFRCVQVRNRNANCMRCAQACTSGCISTEDGVLVVDESRCVGCGTCATVCPTCALESKNPSDAALVEQCMEAVKDTRVVIACHLCAEALQGMLEADSFVDVVCLGRVDESLLAELAARGACDIVLCSGVCAQCEQEPGCACAQDVVATANALFTTWGSACQVSLQEGVPAEVLQSGTSVQDANSALSDYFSTTRANAPIHSQDAQSATAAVQQATEVAVQQDAALVSSQQNLEGQGALEESAYEVLKVMEDGTLPHFLPARRERLLDSLSAMGSAAVGTEIETRLWGCVAIDPDKCISCRMCATFCPTGAIMKYGEQDSDDFGVEHFPGDCVNCGTCEAICPHDAITINTRVKSDYLLGGHVHTFAMLPRAVAMNNSHQIVNTMRSYIDGDIFER